MSRTREFDIDKALEKAMDVFWSKGFNETSLNDLLDATNLHKGSLYSAFESKEHIFYLSLTKYFEMTRSKYFDPNSSDHKPLDYIKNFFARIVSDGSSSKDYKGCLILNSCIEFGMGPSKNAKMSRFLFDEIQRNFQVALDLAIKDGSLKESSGLSARLVAAAFSIREIAKFKRDEHFLKEIANGVLKDIGKGL